MALLSTQVLPDNTLEEFRIEFNKLVTDVSGISSGNTFDTQIIFEGDTDDTFETALSVTDPTADRSIVFPNQSGNVLLDSANISLGDNIELQFGDGTDLKIYHDGSHSYIKDAGTGDLKLQGAADIVIEDTSGANAAVFNVDAGQELYWRGGTNAGKKFETTQTGATVTGDLTISGDDLYMGTNTSGYILVADGTNYNPVAVSGDVTMSNAGAITIANDAVETAMLNDNIISGQTALTSGLATTDELLLSDAGTIKRMDVSLIADLSAADATALAIALG